MPLPTDPPSAIIHGMCFPALAVRFTASRLQLASLFLALALPGFSFAQTLTTFAAPGAGATTGRGTLPLSVYTPGETVGFLIQQDGTRAAFLRGAKGEFTVFQAPGYTTGNNFGTRAVAQNAAGWVTIANGSFRGFVRQANGEFIRVNAALAGTTSGQGTQVHGITASGDVVGYYIDAQGISHGFVQDRNGSFLTIDVPEADQLTSGRGTRALAIDNAGNVSGWYVDAAGIPKGFVLTKR